MATTTFLAAARRCGRSVLTTARSLSPAAAVAVTISLVLGGAGLADAANGGSFLLGKANKETADKAKEALEGAGAAVSVK